MYIQGHAFSKHDMTFLCLCPTSTGGAMPALLDATLGSKQHDQEPAAFQAYAKPQGNPQSFLGRWWKIWLVAGDVLLIGGQGAQTSALCSTPSSQCTAHGS